MIIGFTNGCFDMLHNGHRHLLTEARKHCDRLVVAINTDGSVHHLKGPGRPRNPLATRIMHLNNTNLADVIAVFDLEADLRVLLEVMKPNVIFKGDQYKVEDVVGFDRCPVILIPMLEGISTSLIIAGRS